jgi:hypothetical protein
MVRFTSLERKTRLLIADYFYRHSVQVEKLQGFLRFDYIQRICPSCRKVVLAGILKLPAVSDVT